MEDWPEVLSTSLAWVASDLASDDSCTLNLAANEVTEIKNALRVFRCICLTSRSRRQTLTMESPGPRRALCESGQLPTPYVEEQITTLGC